MNHFLLYDPKEAQTMMFPSGEIVTPEEMLQRYPAIEHFKFVVLTDESNQICFAVENFSGMRSMHNIPSYFTDEEALKELTEIENAPPLMLDDAPSPDERIAAALEMQNLLAIPETAEPINESLSVNPEIVKRNYRRGLWSARHVEMCVKKGLMSDKQRDDILYPSEDKGGNANLNWRARHGSAAICR